MYVCICKYIICQCPQADLYTALAHVVNEYNIFYFSRALTEL